MGRNFDFRWVFSVSVFISSVIVVSIIVCGWVSVCFRIGWY